MEPRTNNRVEVDPANPPPGASERAKRQFELAQQHQAEVHAHRRRYSRGAGNSFALMVCAIMGAIAFDGGWRWAMVFLAGMLFDQGLHRFMVSRGTEFDYRDPPIPKGLQELDE